MYPQAGGHDPQGRPQEPWQQGGTHYGSHSPAHGQASPEPTSPGHVYGSAQPSDPYQQQRSEYPQQPQAPYQQQTQPGSYPQQPSPGYGPPPGGAAPKKKGGNKAMLIVGLVVGGLLLCCGGGTAIVWIVGDSADSTMDEIVASAFPTSTPSGEDEELDGDLDDYQTGDCMTITGANNDMKKVSCGTAGAFKVVLRKNGTISESACKNVDYSEYLYQEGLLGASDGIVLCIAPVKG